MYSFRKAERLCRNSLIEKLYTEGKSFNAYPIRVTYLFVDELLIEPAQVLFIVSKRRFKKANKRNLLKRRLREAYRLHKSKLYNNLTNNNLNIVLSLNYVGNDIFEYSDIENQMIKLINKFENVILEKTIV